MTQAPAAPPSPPPAPAPTPPRRSSTWGCGMFALGCGVIALLFVIAVGIGAWYLWTHAASVVSNVATQIVRNSDLPDEQQQLIVADIDRLANGYEQGRISEQAVVQAASKLVNGPLLQVAMVNSYQARLIEPSTLSAQEKQQAERTLDRLARGLYEGSISLTSLDAVLAPVSVVNTRGARQLLPDPSEQQIQQMLALTLQAADDVGVPDEPFKLNVAEEVDRTIDQLLGDSSAPAKQGR